MRYFVIALVFMCVVSLAHKTVAEYLEPGKLRKYYNPFIPLNLLIFREYSIHMVTQHVL